VTDAIDRYAWLRRTGDGDTRPLGVLRAEVLTDLVLRPWDTSRPPVTASLSIVAPLGTLSPTVTVPGQAVPVAEIGGQPITAAHLTELLTALDVLGVQPPECGSLDVAVTDDAGRLIGAATLPELRRLVRRGCSTHPGASCGCPVLGVPPAVDRYRPTPAQRRFVTTRDRTCRHPGCRNQAGWADLDHVTAHAQGGVTDCANLCCLCRRHHRLKTHGRGWQFRMDPDGTLTVTTPSGVARTSRPPGLEHPGFEHPGFEHPGFRAPSSVGGRSSPGSFSPVTGRPPLPGDDPPPF
jgi:hypothetical protein